MKKKTRSNLIATLNPRIDQGQSRHISQKTFLVTIRRHHQFPHGTDDGTGRASITPLPLRSVEVCPPPPCPPAHITPYTLTPTQDPGSLQRGPRPTTASVAAPQYQNSLYRPIASLRSSPGTSTPRRRVPTHHPSLDLLP